MTTHIGIGFSKDENPFRAAQEAAIHAKLHLDTPVTPVNFVLIFSTVHYSRMESLEIIQETFPQAKIIGCSTSGLILSKTIETRGISILAISSQDIRFEANCLKDITEQNIAAASQEFADQCFRNFGSHRRQLSLLLCDGLLKGSPVLLKSLREKLGQLSPILGAGSSDNFQYAKTYQYFQNEVLSNAAIAVVMGGQMNIGISSQHGWKPLGKPRIINKVDKNIIQEINGKKAISIYEEFFAEQAAALFSSRLNRMRVFYPLGFSVSDERKYLLQNVIEVLEDGSLVCQSDIPEGSEVHIMIGNKDSCKQAAHDAALARLKAVAAPQF